MSIVYFPERKTHIRVPKKGETMSFYFCMDDKKEWKFFENISKQLRELGFLVMTFSVENAGFPKIRYTGLEEILGKKEIKGFVKLLKILHKKNLLETKKTIKFVRADEVKK